MPQYTYVESSEMRWLLFLKDGTRSEEVWTRNPNLISENNPNEKEIEKKES